MFCRVRLRTIAALSAVIVAVALALGCSANSSSKSQAQRAKSMLDQSDYEGAIKILEDEYGKDPQKKSVAVLLAQAHLGAGGVELFDLVAKVMSEQSPSEELDLALKPDCDNEKIDRIQGYDAQCLAMRLLRHLPAPDDPHVARAKKILRVSFPEPSKTPVDVNFLAAFLELGSAISRLKILLKASLVYEVSRNASRQPLDLPYETLIPQFKRLLDEAFGGLLRLKYSYGKLSKFVVALDGKPLVRIGNNTLTFTEDLSMPVLLRFVAQVLDEYSEGLDGDINRVASSRLNSFGDGLIKILSTIDSVQFEDQGKNILKTSFHAQHFIQRLLDSMIETTEKGSARIDVFSIVWNHPPAIFKGFADAFNESWNNENGGALRDYLHSTKGEWNELNRLMFDWRVWTNDDLTMFQRDEMLAYFKQLQVRNPEIFRMPNNMTLAKMGPWQAELAKKLEQEFRDVLNGKVNGLPPLTPEVSDKGLRLFERSLRWVNHNLWSVPELR